MQSKLFGPLLRDWEKHRGIRTHVFDLNTFAVPLVRFTEGLALGGREFLEETFAANAGRMRAVRKVGARRPRDVDLGKLGTLRDLRGEVS